MTVLRAGVALRTDPRKTLVEDSVISGIFHSDVYGMDCVRGDHAGRPDRRIILF